MKKRIYTLAVRDRGTKTWYKVFDFGYTKQTAVKLFQNLLLNYALYVPSVEARLVIYKPSMPKWNGV